MRKRLGFLGLVAILFLQLTAAHVRADNEQYKQLLQEGVNEFAAGNWGEARLLFRRAHELSPTARTLRGLGLCDFELRHYVEAIEEFEASLRDPRRPLTSELRQQIDQNLERARQYVGRYTLQVPEGVHELVVDDKPRPLPDNRELLLDPGRHTVTVQPGKGPVIRREFTVEVGAHDTLAFLQPTAAEPEAPVASEAPATRQAPVQEPVALAPSAQPRVFTWIAAGLTGVFGAGIVGFGLSARAKHTEYLHQAATGAQPDPKLKRSGQTFETLTTASIIGCAVAGAAAITLFVVEGRGGEAEPPVQAGLVPGGAYVRGTF